MRSTLPKVLHAVCGKPMAAHILDAARTLSPAKLVVVTGHESAKVREALAAPDVTFVEQSELLGTADAVARCESALAGCDRVLVLNGDTPMVTPELLRELATASPASPLVFVACTVPSAGQLGRITRDPAGNATGIVEAADWAGPDGAAEINSGQYRFDAAWLWSRLPKIPVSPKGEYYLTHLVSMARAEGATIATVAADPEEALGVDDRARLAEAETAMRKRILARHMEAGVTIIDPATTYIDADVRLGEDVTVLPNCYLHGATAVGTGAVIGPGTTLRGAKLAVDCRVQHSVVEESTIGARVSIGPYAHVRGNSTIGEDCVLGNYAEVNRSRLGARVKMHHFGYLGDAEVGADANIAAGVITNNYDGVHKHRTVIGERAFVGCDTMLVAPVTVGDDAATGSGSVVTKDVPPGMQVVGVPARVVGPVKRPKE